MTTEFRFGLRKRLYNHNMRLAREEKGLTLAQLASQVGCSINYLSNVQAFRAFPGEELQIKLSCALEVSVDSLFPEDIRKFKITKAPRTVDDCSITLSEAKQLGMMNESALLVENWEEDIDNRVDLKAIMDNVLHTLTPREEAVLRDRFGISGGEPMTLEAVGVKQGVKGERIRQIEAKALRKLRHSSRQGKLKGYFA